MIKRFLILLGAVSEFSLLFLLMTRLWSLICTNKEPSMIIYESSEPNTPLIRLGWNKQDSRYMATIIMDSAKVMVLDIRFSTFPTVELQRYQASVNAIAQAPHSSCHICTVGGDSQALIWDLSSMCQPVEGELDPILAYTAGGRNRAAVVVLLSARLGCNCLLD